MSTAMYGPTTTTKTARAVNVRSQTGTGGMSRARSRFLYDDLLPASVGTPPSTGYLLFQTTPRGCAFLVNPSGVW